jgi:hypothetical protein
MRDYLQFFVAFLIIVLLALFLNTRAVRTQPVEQEKPKFSIWQVQGTYNLFLLKHHPTQKCWFVSARGGVLETATEVCN